MTIAFGQTGSADLQIEEISANEAWDILAKDKQAVLVDVRTLAELQFVGFPDLSSLNKEIVTIPWRIYPSMEVNENFAIAMEQAVPQKDTTVIFLCKVGGRSYDAAVAMKNSGYHKVYNITDGFEGQIDTNHHRSKINGWKASNLPWRQQ